MTAVVFLGPSLSLEVARATFDAVYLPPAGHGDLYRVTLRRPKPRAIGLIDGYFRHRPAVRHKEVLWAISQGIHVFGAASIGALRAVELAHFGMVGIGGVFADFRDGFLEDDDEVAVDHGPAELGYLPMNEAMVDIRATLAKAREARVIGAACDAILLAVAKARFYAERSWPGLIEEAAGRGASPAELARLGDWLPSGKVARKREDALALLAALREFLASNPPRPVVTFRFERTESWDVDTSFAAALDPAPSGSASDSSAESGGRLLREHLLDELRLAAGTLRNLSAAGLRSEALAIALARREADRARIAITAAEVEAFRGRWLALRGLCDPTALADWLRRNHLEGVTFDDFIAARAREQRLAVLARDLVDESLVDALRLHGRYADLAERALAKQRALATSGGADLSLAESGLSAFDLLTWFCRERLGRLPPVDVEQFAAELGFPSAEALNRALLRERLYLRLANENDAAKAR